MSGDETHLTARAPPKVDVLDIPLTQRFLPNPELASVDWYNRPMNDMSSLSAADLEARLRWSQAINKRLMVLNHAVQVQHEREWLAKEQLLSELLQKTIHHDLR